MAGITGSGGWWLLGADIQRQFELNRGLVKQYHGGDAPRDGALLP